MSKIINLFSENSEPSNEFEDKEYCQHCQKRVDNKKHFLMHDYWDELFDDLSLHSLPFCSEEHAKQYAKDQWDGEYLDPYGGEISFTEMELAVIYPKEFIEKRRREIGGK